jgi:NTE family protein
MDRPRAWLFDGLPIQELKPELDRLERRRYPADAVIMEEGDPPHEMFIIASGHAAVFTVREGKRLHIRRVGPGTPFGDMSLLTGQAVSACVRASTDLEAWVLDREAFDRLAVTFPRIYANVARILAERLASSTRAGGGSVSVLLDRDAPPLLGLALASSVAWHTRRPTLLLVVPGVTTSAELTARASTEAPTASSVEELLEFARAHASRGDYSPEPLSADEAGAHLRLLEPGGRFPHEDLLLAVEELCTYYGHVMVQVEGETAPPGLDAPAVLLSSTPEPPKAGSPARYTICAWRDPSGIARPEVERVLLVPQVGAADDDALTRGILPATTPAGRALGWAARDLSGLKVGLALGGGTEKGYAHLGVLRVLERAGIEVDYLAGASIGSAVAGAYAQGYTVDQIADMMDALASVIYRWSWSLVSTLSNTGLRLHLRKIIGSTRIEDLRVPLAIVAADLEGRREVVFRRGLLYPALLASMAVPGIYPAQRIGPYTLVDGAVLNPVPSNVAARMGADKVIAVKLRTPLGATERDGESAEAPFHSPRIHEVVFRAFELMQSKIAAETAEEEDAILIQPDVPSVGSGGLRSFSSGRRYIEHGEAAAEAAMARIAKALPWLQR